MNLNLSQSSGPIRFKSTCNKGPESEVLVGPVFTGFGGSPRTPKCRDPGAPGELPHHTSASRPVYFTNLLVRTGVQLADDNNMQV